MEIGEPLTASQLADLLHLSERRVNQLKAQGVLTAVKGRYPVAESVQAYLAFLRRDDEKARDAKARKEAALADRAELDLAERRGDLIPVSQVARVVSEAAANVKARMRALPAKLSRALQGKDVANTEAILQREIDAALTSVANIDVRAAPGENEDEKVSEAA